MVIGYNPSHSNINSEVNAPFKILSTLLRFIDTESKNLADNKTSLAHRQADYSDEEVEEEKTGSGMQSYSMQRCRDLYGGGIGERLDTVEGPNDLYGVEAQEDDEQSDNDDAFNNMADSDDDALDDDSSEEEDLDAQLGIPKVKNSKKKHNPDKIEVNFDEIEDDDDQECLLDLDQPKQN